MDVVSEEGSRSISRKRLFSVWKEKSKRTRNAEVLAFVISFLKLEHFPEHILNSLNVTISRFSAKLNEKWVRSGRSLDNFLAKNSNWLNGKLEFPRGMLSITTQNNNKNASKGRPSKNFGHCSDKTKKRKVQNMIKEQSSQKILLAAEMNLRNSGKRDAANIVKELAQASPKRATGIKKARRLVASQSSQQMTPEQALAFYVSANLTTNQYRLMVTNAKETGSNLYPPYYLIREAKKHCYPPEECISVTENSAEIELQSLLDHTIKRLVQVQEEVLKTVANLRGMSFTLICKWGCDGSSGHSQYKQTLKHEGYDDEYLFVISFVPIQLYAEESGQKLIVWQNPKTSATKYCRPIKLLFSKETDTLIKQEAKRIEDQIASLNPTKVRILEQEIEVDQKLLMTMIDGKVCNALSNNQSSQRCYICGASPTEWNLKNTINRTVDSSTYSFGILSSLHAWIRCFECLLHISYRLDFKKWQVRGEKHKTLFDNKKKQIREEFRKTMCLIVDKPKPGSGSTNDGNTARRFFRNSQETADITGINQNLIHRFYIILQTISCGYDINIDLFKNYVDYTRKLYLDLYPWYYMPASVHKILVHGPEIIKSCILPIGQLSEEAQEARNKDCRRYREHHTRKMCREYTNRDILSMLLISSDPLISSLRKPTHKKGENLSLEAQQLLLNPSHGMRFMPNEEESRPSYSDSD